MADGVQFRLDGLPEFHAVMKQMQGKAAKKMLVKATRAGLKKAHKRAKASYKSHDDPKTPEMKIWKDVIIRINAKRMESSGIVSGKIGIKGGAQHYANDSRNRRQGRVGREYEQGGKYWYFRYLEFGNSRQRAFKLMQNAFDPEEALADYQLSLSKSIEEAIKNMGGG